ncbi:hypothetical protein [Kitasatospora purpeofusca]|uniref:hypothetical protein n=1 Tax=Kitasatospora purpeofusca TaxID=67352 RepID=UPI002A5A291A|nr:hypothetical protein [Kitasatospora purpeofusca]MDY0815171.1 hypothetical protein [Kitasatospora purpeofusca]
MNRFAKASVTALISLTLSLGTIATATSPAVAASPDVCGGAISDYTGLNSVDVPFTGTATNGATSRQFTIIPQMAKSPLVKTELVTASNDVYAIVNFELGVNDLGQGTIYFAVFGGTGYSTGIRCESGTRVTKITGFLHVPDSESLLEFNVSRA